MSKQNNNGMTDFKKTSLAYSNRQNIGTEYVKIKLQDIIEKDNTQLNNNKNTSKNNKTIKKNEKDIDKYVDYIKEMDKKEKLNKNKKKYIEEEDIEYNTDDEDINNSEEDEKIGLTEKYLKLGNEPEDIDITSFKTHNKTKSIIEKIQINKCKEGIKFTFIIKSKYIKNNFCTMSYKIDDIIFFATIIKKSKNYKLERTIAYENLKFTNTYDIKFLIYDINSNNSQLVQEFLLEMAPYLDKSYIKKSIQNKKNKIKEKMKTNVKNITKEYFSKVIDSDEYDSNIFKKMDNKKKTKPDNNLNKEQKVIGLSKNFMC